MSPARVVDILIRSFGYHVVNLTDQGAALVANDHPQSTVVVPLGVDDLDEELVNLHISRAYFPAAEFWTEASKPE